MTAADQPSELLSNLLMEESGNLASLNADEISDSKSNEFINSSGIMSSTNEEKNTLDSEGSELTGTKVTEEPANDQSSPTKDATDSETVDKSNNDDWLDIMGSGDFKKKVIKPGLGEHSRPTRGNRVTINISYYANNQLFEEKKDMKVIMGDLDVVQGVDLALCLMENGEIAKVKIPSKLAYGHIGLSPNVPPSTDIECEIELKEVEQIDFDSLGVSERLALGDEKRTRGNFYYDRNQYIDAIHCYERAADYLDGVRNCSDSSPEELQEIVNMRLKVYNNMAASHLKLSAYSAALKSVEAVLKVQPRNVKALYRKGKILGMQGHTDEAIACMKVAASLEPETKIIQTEMTKLMNRRKKDVECQKAMYQRMFKSEVNKKPSNSVSIFRKWSMISCGVLAVAIGTAIAYRQLHT